MSYNYIFQKMLFLGYFIIKKNCRHLSTVLFLPSQFRYRFRRFFSCLLQDSILNAIPFFWCDQILESSTLCFFPLNILSFLFFLYKCRYQILLIFTCIRHYLNNLNKFMRSCIFSAPSARLILIAVFSSEDAAVPCTTPESCSIPCLR